MSLDLPRMDVWFHSFLTSALNGASGQLHASAALLPGRERPRYPLNSRLGGPQSRSGRFGEKNLSPPAGIRTTLLVNTSS